MALRLLPLALLVLLPLVPPAQALAALPSPAAEGPFEARYLVRVQGSAPVRVEADAPLLVGLARPGEAPAALVPAPAELAAPAGGEWHGLSGVVELVVRREDAARPVLVTASQGSGGVAFEWAAQPEPPREVGSPAVLLVAGALALAAHGARRRRRA